MNNIMNELVEHSDSSQNELVPAYQSPYDESIFKEISGSKFLPRLQLFISSSSAVKEELILMNHYGLVISKDNIQSLGKQVDVLVIAWRPHALDTSDMNNIRSSFDPKSELFLDIKKKSAEKDSRCQFGPEFLLWVPEKEQFATFFMGGASTRREAQNVLSRLRKPATLKSKYIDTGTYQWQSPIVLPCSTPFNPPNKEEMLVTIESFLKPQENAGAEPVEKTPTRER